MKYLINVMNEPSLPESGSDRACAVSDLFRGSSNLEGVPTSTNLKKIPLISKMDARAVISCSTYVDIRLERKKKDINGGLIDFCHRLATADKYTRTSLHDLDLVTTDVAEVCLIHVSHSESYYVRVHSILILSQHLSGATANKEPD
jgi:hypothetical protein